MKQKTYDVLQRLDHESISAAMRLTPLSEELYTAVSDMVERACDKWLVRDLENWDAALPELEWQHAGQKGTFDLVLISYSRGEAVIPDWKTSLGNLERPNYEATHLESPQTYMYLGIGGEWIEREYGVTVLSMHYRCVSPDGALETKSVIREDRHSRIAEEQASATGGLIQVLISQTADDEGVLRFPWPKSIPFACFRGSKEGPTCEYWRDCTSGERVSVTPHPSHMSGNWIVSPRQKSSISKFLECPEHYRRNLAFPPSVRGTASGVMAMDVGTAFGAAVEEIWKQSFALKGEGV